MPKRNAAELADDAPARFNAELQLRRDAVGTWLLLIDDGGVPLPLACFGPDHADKLAAIAAIIDRAQ